jgi:hypothetical protein
MLLGDWHQHVLVLATRASQITQVEAARGVKCPTPEALRPKSVDLLSIGEATPCDIPSRFRYVGASPSLFLVVPAQNFLRLAIGSCLCFSIDNLTFQRVDFPDNITNLLFEMLCLTWAGHRVYTNTLKIVVIDKIPGVPSPIGFLDIASIKHFAREFVAAYFGVFPATAVIQLFPGHWCASPLEMSQRRPTLSMFALCIDLATRLNGRRLISCLRFNCQNLDQSSSLSQSLNSHSSL